MKLNSLSTCFLLLALFSVPLTNAANAELRTMRMVDSLVGELDPYVIGDACVIYGQVLNFEDGGVSMSGPIAFITGTYACNDVLNQLPNKADKRLCTNQVPEQVFSKPEIDVDVINLLKRFDPWPTAVYEVTKEQVGYLLCR